MPRFETPQPISIVLELRAADVRISASERTETTVEVRPSDPSKPEDVTAAEETSVEYADGTLVVKELRRSRSPKWRHLASEKQFVFDLEWNPFRSGGSIDIEIEVPAGSDLKAQTATGDLTCTGSLRRCQLQSAAGDISVERVTGDFKLETATGDLRAGVIEGSAQVKGASSDILIREVAGDLLVNTANGDVDIDRSHGAVTLKTANGDLRIRCMQSGSLAAESARSDIDVGVAEGVAAWLDLQTGLGQVKNDLDGTEPPAPGEEKVEIRVRTAFGNVAIHHAEPGGEPRAVGSELVPDRDA